MCDYSLCGLPSRLAVEGETLEFHRFLTGSVGLASSRELHGGTGTESRQLMVVCIPPGAELLLRDIPQLLRQRHGVEAEERVRFTQTSFEISAYRDAIRFRNGVVVGLQQLPEGLRAEVLSLTGEAQGWRPAVFDSEPSVVSNRR